MCVCRCKEDKRVPVLTLPRLLSQDTEVRLTTEPLAGLDLAAWQPIERVVKDAVTGQDRCGYYLQFTVKYCYEAPAIAACRSSPRASRSSTTRPPTSCSPGPWWGSPS